MSAGDVHNWFSGPEMQVLKMSPTNAQKWTEEVSRCYSEKGRYYHTLQHISDMMHHFHNWREQVKDHAAVVIAILFHESYDLLKTRSGKAYKLNKDYNKSKCQQEEFLLSAIIVYNPQSSSNEVDSIELFKTFAGEVVLNDQLSDKVAELIKATIKHLPGDSSTADSDLLFFLDFDMAILGQSQEVYDVYAANIRKEYCHMSTEDFCNGRTKVLQSFMARPRIYFTEQFHKAFEDQARQNMLREIDSLQQQIKIST